MRINDSGPLPSGSGMTMDLEQNPPAVLNHLSVRGRYIKRERDASPWIYIPDTPDALADAIRRGAMFATWCSFSHEPRPGSEPVRYGDLPLDFDDREHPENALEDLRRLCCQYFPETYSVAPRDIRFFCSGGKGFHAEIPAHFFAMEVGDPYLPLIYEDLVKSWDRILNLRTLDQSMYCMGKGKMFRLPNIRRANGRYKVPLSCDEVGSCSIDEFLRLSEAPRGV